MQFNRGWIYISSQLTNGIALIKNQLNKSCERIQKNDPDAPYCPFQFLLTKVALFFVSISALFGSWRLVDRGVRWTCTNPDDWWSDIALVVALGLFLLGGCVLVFGVFSAPLMPLCSHL
jgi:hypothetical protein